MTVFDSENEHAYFARQAQQDLDAEPAVYKSRRFHLRWTKVLAWTGIVVLVIIIALGTWGYFWLKGKESRMKLPAASTVLAPKESGRPETTLVIGVDKGSVPGEAESRSDILMLVSVSPDGKKSAVISLPRDTRTTIAGHGTQKINAAHAFGGPALTIKTVSEFTGLPINHFVEIDFNGFKQIVNAMGGVKMNIPKAIHDKYAGDVPAGDVVLNGDQALALVRARYSMESGDLDRIKNQRNFLQAMLGTVSKQRNPFKVMSVVDEVSKNVKTDLTFLKMLSLGRKLHGGNAQMTTVPGQPKVIGGLWYYIADMPAFRQMLTTFESKQEVPQDSANQADTAQASRSDISVAVLNGSGTKGLASTAAAKLKAAGYGTVTVGNAASRYPRTTIYYANGAEAMAQTVAGDLPGAGKPDIEASQKIASSYATRVVVVMGADYGG
ncbi:MAG TPA: LCP family protein [Candidatus Anoxymicrobiaceae bacterium]